MEFIDPNSSAIRAFVRNRILGPWGRELHVQALDEGEVLSRVAQGFGFPRRWNGLTTFLRKTIRGMAIENAGTGGTPLDLDKISSVQPDGAGLKGNSVELTANEVARHVGVRPETVYRWARKGKILYQNQGGALTFTPDSLEQARGNSPLPGKSAGRRFSFWSTTVR